MKEVERSKRQQTTNLPVISQSLITYELLREALIQRGHTDLEKDSIL